MDEYEKRIREKLGKSDILTVGEWVYLVGLFQLANEHDELAAENEALRRKVKAAAASSEPQDLGLMDRGLS